MGTICLFQSKDHVQQEKLTDKELELLHLSTIFGEFEPHIIRWLRQPDGWTCTTANDYNLEYGSCKRERLRWKERIKLNTFKRSTIKQDL